MDEENLDTTTQYGEFVCSLHQWLPLDIQKEQTEKMNEMTKRKKIDK